MFTELLQRIDEYFVERGLCKPNAKDAAIFLSCECAELLDCIMRKEPQWMRNNAKEIDMRGEVADVLFMLLVTAKTLGIDPVEAMLEKMQQKTQG